MNYADAAVLIDSEKRYSPSYSARIKKPYYHTYLVRKQTSLAEEGNRFCVKCEQVKALTEFTQNKENHLGKRHICKKCSSLLHKEWRQKNLCALRKKDRINHYVRKYGLPIEEAETLCESRLGTCEICNEQKQLVIDHCHKSGKVRGKICSHCNSVLGYANENIDILLRATHYIRKHKK